jgi:class 3 adenylate cyclase
LPTTVFDPFASVGLFKKSSNLWITEEIRTEFAKEIEREDSELRRLSTRPIERSFVYFDVSDFSKHPDGQQALVVNSISGIVSDHFLWETMYAREIFQAYEAMLCTGDGYIFVFNEPSQATYFGAHLALIIETMVAKKGLPVEFHFRIGIHTGPVFSFWDFDRAKWNYIGDGINGGKRVLDAVGKETDDVVFISDKVKESIVAQRHKSSLASKIVPHWQNRGRRLDKHGKPWRVFELNHGALCGPELPPSLLNA